MAYDPDLVDRIRECLAGVPGLSERSMFGGLAFLVNGHMTVGASGHGGLLLRVEPDQTEELAARAHAERAVMGGRTMNGWLRIDPGGLRTKRDLTRWIALGVSYVHTRDRGVTPSTATNGDVGTPDLDEATSLTRKAVTKLPTT